MKSFTGWVISAGLVLTTAGAQAQLVAPYETGIRSYTAVSDISGPYAAMPRDIPPPRRGPMLLPPAEIYTVAREAGFSPRGIPQQRGFVYTVSVINRGGGRLIIDARNGRIIRFMRAYGRGDGLNEALTMAYGPVGPPPITGARGVPRPPRSIPNVASRTVPMPKASPLAATPAPEPAQQSAIAQPKPADASPPPPDPDVTGTIGQTQPPASAILPTQEMPKVQGLE